MQILAMAQEVQIPLLAALLLGGCATKLVRALRAGSLDAGLGPTALFPMRLRAAGGAGHVRARAGPGHRPDR